MSNIKRLIANVLHQHPFSGNLSLHCFDFYRLGLDSEESAALGQCFLQIICFGFQLSQLLSILLRGNVGGRVKGKRRKLLPYGDKFIQHHLVL